MADCWFLDWTASASAPWSSAVIKGEILVEDADFLRNGDRLPKVVQYWRRIDGVFLYQLNLLDQDSDEGLSVSEMLKLASLVSSLIKRKEGPQNGTISATLAEIESRTGSFPTISVSPIKLHSSCNLSVENVAEHLESEEKLLSLSAKPIGRRLKSLHPALYLMRRQFAGAFDKAYQVKILLKSQRVENPLNRLSHKRPRYLFRKYTWHAPVCIYATFVLVLSLIDIGRFLQRLNGAQASVKDIAEQAFIEFVDKALVLGFLVTFALFVVVILIRRAKTLKAIDRSLTVLQLGNIYCSVLTDIAKRAGKPQTDADFSSAIEALRDMKRIEVEKRAQNLAIMLPAAAICWVPLAHYANENVKVLARLGEIIKEAFTLPFV